MNDDLKFHPDLQVKEIWPGPEGYPWAHLGVRCWTREGILRRTGLGELFASWTTGGFTEPWAGNFTMIRRSEDDGHTWIDAGVIRHPTRGLFATETFVAPNGELHTFIMTYAPGVWMTQLHSYRAVSRDGGRSWSGPHSIPGGIHNVWVNRGIVLQRGGRWVLPVSWAEHIGDEWAEPHTGHPPDRVQMGTRFPPQLILPTGTETIIRNQNANAWADRNHRYACGVMLSDDSGATFRLRGYLTGGRNGHLIEPRVVELDGGRLVMLIRSQQDGWLWRSESLDGGETWSPAAQSEIANPASKVLLLRGGDGRIYLIHNPHGRRPDGTMSARNPLSLWISEDQMKTWSTKIDLVTAVPDRNLNYPDGFLDEEKGELVFVWEDAVRVYLCRFSV